MFQDLLTSLPVNRQMHSIEVGRKAASVAHRVPAQFRAELVASATLHDLGYGHAATGLHALDGAAALKAAGFSPLVCHLVAHHSHSLMEAEVRGVDRRLYEKYSIDLADDILRPLNSIICWADMTTGPTGETVTVQERLSEILRRYAIEHPVARFVEVATPVLLAEVQASSSMYGSE